MAPIPGIEHTEATKNGVLYKRSATCAALHRGADSLRCGLAKNFLGQQGKANSCPLAKDRPKTQNQTQPKTDKHTGQIPKQNLEDEDVRAAT